MQLFVRKFICRNPTCVRRIFSERLPGLVATYARKTCRLVAVLQAIDVALRGNAGARLAARLRLPTRRLPSSGWYGRPWGPAPQPCRPSRWTSGRNGEAIGMAPSSSIW